MSSAGHHAASSVSIAAQHRTVPRGKELRSRVLFFNVPILGYLRSCGIDPTRLYLRPDLPKGDGGHRPWTAASAGLRQTHEILFEFVLLGGVDGDAARHARCPGVRRKPE